MSVPRVDLLGRTGAFVLGVACLAAALPGAFLAPRVFFAAWLAGCWCALGIALGAIAWQLVHRLTGGAWGEALRAPTLRLAARMPIVLALFVPIAFGFSLLYGGSRVDDALPEHAFLRVWQAPAFVVARCLVYAVCWLALARLFARGASKGQAAAALLAHLGVTSLGAIDAIATLVPRWSSTGFALAVLAGQACGGLAFVVLLACAGKRDAAVQPRSVEGMPLTRDFGNLLLTAVLLWAYLVFMPLLITWAENLPREIAWYVPRLQTGWVDVGIALVVVHFALPLVALLFRAIKDSPRRLGVVAAALLGAHGLDAAWLVVPSVAPTDLRAWWLAPLCIAGIALVAFGGRDLPWRRRRRDARLPPGTTADANA